MGKKTSEKADDNLEFKVGDRVKANIHRGRIVEAERRIGDRAVATSRNIQSNRGYRVHRG